MRRPPDRLSRSASSSSAGGERGSVSRARSRRWGRSLAQLLPRHAPALERLARRSAERDHALLVALADDAQHAAAQVEVRPVERHQLADAQAARVEQLEDDAVAIDQRAGAGGRRQQQLDLGRTQVPRQRALGLGRLQVQRRIRLHQSLARGPAKERAQRRQRSPLRSARDAAAQRELGEEAADGRGVEIGGTESLGLAAEIGGGELRVAPQIAAVGLDRALRHPALVGEMLQERDDRGLHPGRAIRLEASAPRPWVVRSWSAAQDARSARARAA